MDKEFLDTSSSVIEQQFTLGQLTVTTRAAGFLVIGFYRTRDLEMGDKSEVGTVDAHAKGICRYHHVAIILGETILGCFSGIIIDSAMVSRHSDTPGFKLVAHLVYALARCAIDNTRSVPADQFAETLILLRFTSHFGNDESHVGPGDSGPQYLAFAQAQAIDDIGAYFWCRVRGKSCDLTSAKFVQHRT